MNDSVEFVLRKRTLSDSDNDDSASVAVLGHLNGGKSKDLVGFKKNQKVNDSDSDPYLALTERKNIQLSSMENIPLINLGVVDAENEDDDNARSDAEDSTTRESIDPVVVRPSISSAASDESSWIIALQILFPYLIAGCGTVGAGLVLDIVQHWRVFIDVQDLFILVPALLGLKGNLEMTLASRLSTHANLGRMDTRQEKLQHIIGNLTLIEAQAMVIAFLASVFAIVLGWIPTGTVQWSQAFMMCASSMLTAALASFILGLIMVAVIIGSRLLHINPDNVATPIAASLGDLTTLAILAFTATFLNNAQGKLYWLSPMVVAILVLLTPLWMYIAARNEHTYDVLVNGWSPVVFSMMISSVGGFILNRTVVIYRGIAVFQPVINGIGGNLVAVQASRISTSLHRESTPGVLPATAILHHGGCVNPADAFCGTHVHARAARVLLALVIPGHLIFMYMIHFLKAGHTTITPMFALVYLTACTIQVVLLMYICVWMVHAMWMRGVDPDNSAIPYLTAFGDLFGTAFLAIAFYVLHLIGDNDLDVGD